MYKELILIDYSWLYNKYFFVAKQQDPDTTSKTCFNMLKQFLQRIPVSYPNSKVFIILDSALHSTGTLNINENYKQNRDKKSKKEVYKDLKEITLELIEVLPNNFSFIKAHGYEADYVIAVAVKKFQKKVDNILIFSGDKDLFQLTYYPNVYVSDKFKDGKFLIKTDKDIFEKFKNSKGEDFTRISTNKRDLLKYRVLKGDKSDNLPPAFPRIKDTEIAYIIKEYWIDEEELTDVRINDIIDDIQGDNPTLANKLRENADIWLSNWKLMNLLDVDVNIGIKKL